ETETQPDVEDEVVGMGSVPLGPTRGSDVAGSVLVEELVEADAEDGIVGDHTETRPPDEFARRRHAARPGGEEAISGGDREDDDRESGGEAEPPPSSGWSEDGEQERATGNQGEERSA